jgi:hypothetical protein
LGNSWKEAMPTYTSPAYDLHHVHKLESKCTGIKLICVCARVRISMSFWACD